MVREEEPVRVEPSTEDSYHSLYRKASVYFQKLIVQDKYIKSLTRIIKEAEGEIKRFDNLQLEHEKEIREIKDHYEIEHSKSLVHQLRTECIQSAKTIKKLQLRVQELEVLTRNGGIPLKISNRKVDKFSKQVQHIINAMGTCDSPDAKKIKLITACFAKTLGLKVEDYFSKEELGNL
jgi:predicted RNase H-like nuclease (RuvC/YqgF family)